MEQPFLILDRSARWRSLSPRWLFVAWLGLAIYCPVQALAKDPDPSPIVSVTVGGTGSNYAIIKINVPADLAVAPCGAKFRGEYAVDEKSDGGKAALATALVALRPVG